MKKLNEAINIGLSALGEPVLGIEESIDGIFEAEQASFIIEQVKDELLSQGWFFNTDDEWKFLKDTNNYINIPSSVLKVSSTSSNVVFREFKLYDKDNQTFKFTNLDFVTCETVWNLDFDDIPYSFQRYISLKAARILSQRLSGETSLINLLLKDEADALFVIKQEENDTATHNIFDNIDVSRIVDRASNPDSTI